MDILRGLSPIQEPIQEEQEQEQEEEREQDQEVEEEHDADSIIVLDDGGGDGDGSKGRMVATTTTTTTTTTAAQQDEAPSRHEEEGGMMKEGKRQRKRKKRWLKFVGTAITEGYVVSTTAAAPGKRGGSGAGGGGGGWTLQTGEPLLVLLEGERTEREQQQKQQETVKQQQQQQQGKKQKGAGKGKGNGKGKGKAAVSTFFQKRKPGHNEGEGVSLLLLSNGERMRGRVAQRSLCQLLVPLMREQRIVVRARSLSSMRGTGGTGSRTTFRRFDVALDIFITPGIFGPEGYALAALDEWEARQGQTMEARHRAFVRRQCLQAIDAACEARMLESGSNEAFLQAAAVTLLQYLATRTVDPQWKTLAASDPAAAQQPFANSSSQQQKPGGDGTSSKPAAPSSASSAANSSAVSAASSSSSLSSSSSSSAAATDAAAAASSSSSLYVAPAAAGRRRVARTINVRGRQKTMGAVHYATTRSVEITSARAVVAPADLEMADTREQEALAEAMANAMDEGEDAAGSTSGNGNSGAGEAEVGEEEEGKVSDVTCRALLDVATVSEIPGNESNASSSASAKATKDEAAAWQPKAMVRLTLHTYQQHGLVWLLKREHMPGLTRGGNADGPLGQNGCGTGDTDSDISIVEPDPGEDCAFSSMRHGLVPAQWMPKVLPKEAATILDAEKHWARVQRLLDTASQRSSGADGGPTALGTISWWKPCLCCDVSGVFAEQRVTPEALEGDQSGIVPYPGRSEGFQPQPVPQPDCHYSDPEDNCWSYADSSWTLAEFHCQSFAVFFINPCTKRIRLSQPPRVRECRGGLLADEMGLGKTLEILALVLADLERNFNRIPRNLSPPRASSSPKTLEWSSRSAPSSSSCSLGDSGSAAAAAAAAAAATTSTATDSLTDTGEDCKVDETEVDLTQDAADTASEGSNGSAIDDDSSYHESDDGLNIAPKRRRAAGARARSSRSSRSLRKRPRLRPRTRQPARQLHKATPSSSKRNDTDEEVVSEVEKVNDDADSGSDGVEEVEARQSREVTATLVVAPMSVMGQWHSEFENHTPKRYLRMSEYYSHRTRDRRWLAAQDVVFTTYGVLVSEYKQAVEQNKRSQSAAHAGAANAFQQTITGRRGGGRGGSYRCHGDRQTPNGHAQSRFESLRLSECDSNSGSESDTASDRNNQQPSGSNGVHPPQHRHNVQNQHPNNSGSRTKRGIGAQPAFTLAHSLGNNSAARGRWGGAASKSKAPALSSSSASTSSSSSGACARSTGTQSYRRRQAQRRTRRREARLTGRRQFNAMLLHAHLRLEDAAATRDTALFEEDGQEQEDDVPVATEGLFSIRWRRVVLDEAHNIKNPSTEVSKACHMLCAQNRWAVTGTPLQNSITDVFSLFRFVRYEPWCETSWWRRVIMIPHEQGDAPTRAAAFSLLRDALAPVLLRRTKATKDEHGQPIVKLPERTIRHVYITLPDAEAQFYNALLEKSREEVRAYRESGLLTRSYAAIFTLLLRLRQACDHPLLVFGRGDSSATDTAATGQLLNATRLDSSSSSSSSQRSSSEDDNNDVVEVRPNGNNAINNRQQRVTDELIRELYRNFQNRVAGRNPAAGSASSSATPAATPGRRGTSTKSKSYIDNVIDQIQDEEFEQNECPICLEPFENRACVIACGHILCRSCIRQLLEANGLCPYCQAHVSMQTTVSLASQKALSRTVASPPAPPTPKPTTASDALSFFGGSSSSSAAPATATAAAGNCSTSGGGRAAAGPVASPVRRAEWMKTMVQQYLYHDVTAAGAAAVATASFARGMSSSSSSSSSSSANSRAVPEEGTDDQDLSEDKNVWYDSAKLQAVFAELAGALSRGPDIKVVVFSQFTFMLDVIEVALRVSPNSPQWVASSADADADADADTDAETTTARERQWDYVRLDGSMSRANRESAIEKFRTDAKVRVFLCSLRAGGVGLNLVSASTLLLVDNWWNPSIIDQAIDRVHRIGQTRPVDVVHFIVSDTVEEHMLGLQERKRQLARDALRDSAEAAGAAQRLTLNDLMGFFKSAEDSHSSSSTRSR